MNRAEIRFAFPKGVFFPSPVVVCMALIFFFLVSFSTPAITGPNRSYLLQVGSFVSEAKAAQEVKRLEDYGAFTAPATVNAEKWNRVYVGPYRDKTAAKKQGALMKQRGVISGYLTCPQFAGPGAMAPPTAGRGVSDRPAVLSRQGSPAKMRPVKDSLTVAAATVAPPSSPVAAKAAAPAPVVVPASPVKASPASSRCSARQPNASFISRQGSAPQQAAAPAGLRSGRIFINAVITRSLPRSPIIWYGYVPEVCERKLYKGFVHGRRSAFPTTFRNVHLSDLNRSFQGNERHYSSNSQGFFLEQFRPLRFRRPSNIRCSPPAVYPLRPAGMQLIYLSPCRQLLLGSGQQYTAKGAWTSGGRRQYGIKAPLGIHLPPVFISLRQGHVPAGERELDLRCTRLGGGGMGLSFGRPSFSSNGWGGNVDAHVTWNIKRGLTMGRRSSAGITDTRVPRETPWTNGYYSGII